jgi:histidine triad (HIT) family protein
MFPHVVWHIELMECEFCNIIQGTSSAEILFANRHAIAILDINPIHFGHVLVIPKTHASTFIDVPEEELAGLMHATKVISVAIMKSLNPPGFNIFSNNGKAAGQSIHHCHFHVTPRYDDDNIQFILKLKKYACGEMATYGDRIRQHISTQPIHEYM